MSNSPPRSLARHGRIARSGASWPPTPITGACTSSTRRRERSREADAEQPREGDDRAVPAPRTPSGVSPHPPSPGGTVPVERWEIEARLNRSRASLLETYAAMSAAERSRPATNSALNAEVEWTAGDHFLHIIDPEQQIVEAIRRQVAGEEFPYPVLFDAEGNRLSSDVFLPIIHARNDTWLADHHDLTFDQIVALGAEVRARVLKLL